MTSGTYTLLRTHVPYGRGVIALLCIGLAFVAPWWSALVLAVLVFVARGYPEVLIAGPVVDALYFEGWYMTAACVCVYLATRFLKRFILPGYTA